MDQKSKNVLLIEDDRDICEIYAYSLTNAGFNVEAIYDGELGLERIKENKSDLILLDIVLPKINGIEIIKEVLSETFPVKSLKIIIIGEISQEEIIEEALKLGIRHFILKGKILPKELLQIVNRSLNEGKNG